MSDQANFNVDPTQEEEAEVIDEIAEELEDFDLESEALMEGDERVVTIRYSGDSDAVPWEEGLTLEQALTIANTNLSTRSKFFMNDVELEMDTVLPAGATVVAVGASQKGG